MIAITFFRCRKKQLLSDCRQLVPDCLLFSKKKPAKEQKTLINPQEVENERAILARKQS